MNMISKIARLNILAVWGGASETGALQDAFESANLGCVVYADSLQTASRLCTRETWDLLIIDADLSNGAGLELLVSARAHDRWTAAMIVTSALDADVAGRAIDLRVDGLLLKDADPAILVGKAIALAERAKQTRRAERKSVLAVGAHPDDVEIGCGGALARHRARGDRIQILTLSRGSAGGDIEVRSGEAHCAAKILGAELAFGDLQDANIPEGVHTIGCIQQAIRAFWPTHVYTHSHHDAHQDHRNVHSATLVAAREVPNVYCYQSPSSTVDFRPNLFIDITAHIDSKLALLAVYQSQLHRGAGLDSDVTRATARYWGRHARHLLAEPMEIIRQREA